MRIKNLKNYVILAIIFIITIVLVICLRNAYLCHKKNEEKTNTRLNILYEIKEEDLKSYLVENTDSVIYVSHASDDSLITFEEDFKNYIAKNEISREIIYLNLDKVSSTFYETLKEKYSNDYIRSKENIVFNQANIFIVEEGKIRSILYEQKNTITLSDVEYFLKTNDVVEK